MLDLTPLAVPASLQTITPLLPPPPARILEVGCGRGALAEALIARGWQLTGIEPDPDAAVLARARGVPIRPVRLADSEPDRVDAVLFTRSLHHVDDLDVAVRAAADRLVAGGTLILEEFDRQRCDPAGAAFVYDTTEVLAAAGAAQLGEGVGGTPWERWQADRGEDAEHPLHTGAAMLAAVRRVTGSEPRIAADHVDALWGMVTMRLLGPYDSAAQTARTLRTIERRRIAEGSLPGLGFVASARVG